MGGKKPLLITTAKGPGEDGVAPTASLNGMRRSEKAEVLEKA